MGVQEEKARQACWCFTKTGRQLNPVKATRCHKMWDESTAFSRRLHTAEVDIANLKKATDTLIVHTEKFLSGATPQDYQQTPDGAPTPVPGSGQPLINQGRLPRSKSLELKEAVQDPITQHQQEYTRLKGRMAELDKASLRLDNARRVHYKGAQQELKENVMKTDNVSAPRRVETDNPDLMNARAAFQQLEEYVYDDLRKHAENGRKVQNFITQAMRIQAARLSEAADAHSQPFSPEAVPGSPTSVGSQGATAGFSNVPSNSATPVVA